MFLFILIGSQILFSESDAFSRYELNTVEGVVSDSNEIRRGLGSGSTCQITYLDKTDEKGFQVEVAYPLRGIYFIEKFLGLEPEKVMPLKSFFALGNIRKGNELEVYEIENFDPNHKNRLYCNQAVVELKPDGFLNLALVMTLTKETSLSRTVDVSELNLIFKKDLTEIKNATVTVTRYFRGLESLLPGKGYMNRGKRLTRFTCVK